MKDSTIIIIQLLTIQCLLAIGIIEVKADEISAKVFTHSFLTDDDTYSRGNSGGLELTYSPNGKGFLFVSDETVRVSIIYPSFTYTFTGVGVGHKIKLTKDIRLVAQVGYYFIKNNVGERQEGDNEGFSYYNNKRFSDPLGGQTIKVDAIGVLNDNALGASIGLEFDYKVSTNLKLVSSLSARFLKFDETIITYNHEMDKIPRNWWQSTSNRDFSSLNFGVGLNYEF